MAPVQILEAIMALLPSISPAKSDVHYHDARLSKWRKNKKHITLNHC